MASSSSENVTYLRVVADAQEAYPDCWEAAVSLFFEYELQMKLFWLLHQGDNKPFNLVIGRFPKGMIETSQEWQDILEGEIAPFALCKLDGRGRNFAFPEIDGAPPRPLGVRYVMTNRLEFVANTVNNKLGFPAVTVVASTENAAVAAASIMNHCGTHKEVFLALDMSNAVASKAKKGKNNKKKTKTEKRRAAAKAKFRSGQFT